MTFLIILLCIIFVLLLLLTAVLLTYVDVGVEYYNRGSKKYFYLRFKIFNLIPFKIPLKIKEKEKKKEKKKENKLTVKNFISASADFKLTYEEIKDDIKHIISDIREKVSVKEIEFDVYFGTENAATTGIMTGAVGAGANLIAKVLDAMFGADEVYVNVTPDFERKIFNIYFKGILKLRLVNIMIIIYKIMQIINKFKENLTTNNEKAVLENGRTSN